MREIFLGPLRLRRSLARPRETRFARPNRRTCSQAIRWFVSWSAVFVETVIESSFGFTYLLFGAVVALYHVNDVFGVTVNVTSDRSGFACRVECV